MRHLAARFVRHIGASRSHIGTPLATSVLVDPIYVLDPQLDMRHLFENDSIHQNFTRRKIFIKKDLKKMQEEYSLWWRSYQNYLNTNEEDDDKRLELRQKLLDNSVGLCTALAFPNELEEQPEHRKIIDESTLSRTLDENMEKIAQKIKFVYSQNSFPLLRRILRQSLLELTWEEFKSNLVQMSSTSLVRPALVQCCNIGLECFPVITDGIDSPICLVGTDLPGFLPILVKNEFIEKTNNWPLLFMTSGPSYKTISGVGHFQQTELITILVLARNQLECSVIQTKIRSLLKTFLEKLIHEKFDFNPVEVPKLELWESSAISAHWKSVEGIELAELARFSNIGDYLSRRGQIMLNRTTNAQKENERLQQRHFLHMAFTRINLDALAQCLLSNTDR